MTGAPQRKAVHFGAGNIGRGFVGLLLHQGGYDLVFSDVAAPLVDAINAVDSYTVHEVGEGGGDTVVTGFRAINSAEDPAGLVAEIADADVVTTAVGPTVLKFVAAPIVAALRRRDPARAPLQVMACENAIGATDLLKQEIVSRAGDDWADLEGRAVFANTAVDRIVPGQPADGGVDVTVEPFYEWAIERGPFGDTPPNIPGAHFVDDLAPYIERKLFTVNTGHAATAYLGARVGIERISDALADEIIAGQVAATTMAPTRIGAMVLGAFGALALVLAAVGLYGVISHSVARRTREVGIRIALGAERGQVLRLILFEGGRLAIVGIVLGVIGAAAAARVLESLLYGVSSVDPVAYTVAAAVLMLVALAANLIPAITAARLDPVRALRAE